MIKLKEAREWYKNNFQYPDTADIDKLQELYEQAISEIQSKQAGYIKQEEKPVFDELVGKRAKIKIQDKNNKRTEGIVQRMVGYYDVCEYQYHTKEELMENFWIEGVNC